MNYLYLCKLVDVDKVKEEFKNGESIKPSYICFTEDDDFDKNTKIIFRKYKDNILSYGYGERVITFEELLDVEPVNVDNLNSVNLEQFKDTYTIVSNDEYQKLREAKKQYEEETGDKYHCFLDDMKELDYGYIVWMV